MQCEHNPHRLSCHCCLPTIQQDKQFLLSLRKALLDALHCDTHGFDVVHPGIAAAEEAWLCAVAAFACTIDTMHVDSGSYPLQAA